MIYNQCVIWTKILTRQQDRLLIKITRPVLLGPDIIMVANNNSHSFNLSTGQVTKNVASPAQNEPVIGLEDRLLLTRWTIQVINDVFNHQLNNYEYSTTESRWLG